MYELLAWHQGRQQPQGFDFFYLCMQYRLVAAVEEPTSLHTSSAAAISLLRQRLVHYLNENAAPQVRIGEIDAVDDAA